VRPSTTTKRAVEEPSDGPHAVPPRIPEPPRTPKWKRKIASVSRWLHVYLSMVSFAILFFFAVTGLTLNHQQWFANQQRTTQSKGKMDVRWLRTSDPKNVAKLEIVEYLRTQHKLASAMSEFRIDDGQCSVSFKGPGYTADVFIDRDSGTYDLTETKMGLAAILNDLHKGRDSGRAWSLIIDISAVFMTFVSVSGLVLLCFLQKRRFSGFLAAGVGAALCYAIYLIWVP
jgi:hypothetical protein